MGLPSSAMCSAWKPADVLHCLASCPGRESTPLLYDARADIPVPYLSAFPGYAPIESEVERNRTLAWAESVNLAGLLNPEALAVGGEQEGGLHRQRQDQHKHAIERDPSRLSDIAEESHDEQEDSDDPSYHPEQGLVAQAAPSEQSGSPGDDDPSSMTTGSTFSFKGTASRKRSSSVTRSPATKRRRMLDFQRGIDLRKHPRWTPSEAERHRGVVWMEYVLDRKGRTVCVPREVAKEMRGRR